MSPIKNPKRLLTDRTVKALPPADPGKRYVVWDAMDGYRGFGVRVTDTGQRTFIVMRRPKHQPKLVRFALGGYDPISFTLADARTKAKAALRALESGQHPQQVADRERREDARKRQHTFETVANDYRADHLTSLRTGDAVWAAIERDLISEWRTRQITDIERADVGELLKKIKAKSPSVAHHALAYARGLFNWALAQEIYGLDVSPCDRIKAAKVIGKKEPRQRRLTPDELRLIWRATYVLGWPFCPLVRMLMLTGQRLREVAHAQKSEFNWNEDLWIIDAKRMKGNAAHEVPLPPLTAASFKNLPTFAGKFVFTTMAGDRPVAAFSKTKERLHREIGRLRRLELGLPESEAEAGRVVKQGDEVPWAIPGWTFHDLRRAMRTGLSALPVPEGDIVRELVISHAKSELHKIYDLHAYRDEKREALRLWENRLMSIVRLPA
jgi:integrase